MFWFIFINDNYCKCANFFATKSKSSFFMILFGNKFFRRKGNTFFVNFAATNTKKIAMRRITIITGASHTGKTLLAQKILESCAMPYLSIDHLKMGLIRSGSTDLTAQDDDALTDFLWPIVREIIKTAIENHQNQRRNG